MSDTLLNTALLLVSGATLFYLLYTLIFPERF